MYQKLWVPSGRSGGWGVGGVELPRFARVTALQRFAVLLKEITMLYRVDVQWGEKKIRHYCFTRSQAYEWMRQYPFNEDILIVIRNMITNERIGFKYQR